VVAVDMGVDAVHALEYLAHQRRERLGKRHACCWLVLASVVHTGHFESYRCGSGGPPRCRCCPEPSSSAAQCTPVPASWSVACSSRNPATGTQTWSVSMRSKPGVFQNILVRRLHLRARLGRAELGDGAIEEVDLVVKVHHCHPVSVCFSRGYSSRMPRTVDSQPLILVFALGELHHLAEAPAAECCLGILAKLVARSAAFAGHSRSELVLRPVVAAKEAKLATLFCHAALLALGRRQSPVGGLGCRRPRQRRCAGCVGKEGGVQSLGFHCTYVGDSRIRLTRLSGTNSWREPGAWARERMLLN
jgi:hypothetical protein